MAWQDYMNDGERAEYNAAKEKKDKTDKAFNLVSRKMKIRCDARKRRTAFNPDVPSKRSKNDLPASQLGRFDTNDTSNKGG